jgi:membrane protease YdiL (CAAX protease family)
MLLRTIPLRGILPFGEGSGDKRVLVGHVAPFLLWIGVIFLVQALNSGGLTAPWLHPWSYALKSIACAVLFFWLKPWRVYSALQRRNVMPALLAGILVALIWIFPESMWLRAKWPGVYEIYCRWLITMPGSLPSYFPDLPPGHSSWSYAPQSAGWILTIAKLVGSCCVIAVIEEFFFRGFLYRRLICECFWKQPLREFDLQPFLITVAVFGLEHDRWLAGMIAGAVYGALIVWRGDIWAAALAHGVTNFLLGLYVIAMQQYAFW